MTSSLYQPIDLLFMCFNLFVLTFSDFSIENCGWSWWIKAGVAAAAGVGTVTVALPLLGFTSAGIAAGSYAAGAMSAAAAANGGGVAAGSAVAAAQSLATAGAVGAAKVGVAVYAAEEVADRANCYLKNKNK